MNADRAKGQGFLGSRWNVVLIGFALVAGFFLVTEHTAHVFGVLPYLLLLACPLMHLFGHHGHNGHHGHGEDKIEGSEERKSPVPTEDAHRHFH